MSRPAIVGLASAVVLLNLGVAGVAARFVGGGRSPIADALAQLSPNFVRPRPAVVNGRRGHFAIPLSPGWQRYTDAWTAQHNPQADVWVSRPSDDAHILTVTESLDASQVIDVQKVLDAMRPHTADVVSAQEVGRGVFPGAYGQPYRELDVRLRSIAMTLRYIQTVRVNANEVIQHSAFFALNARDRVEPQVMEMLQRAEYPVVDAVPPAPAGAADAVMSRVGPGPIEGRAARYTLTLPARMYQYSDAFAGTANPDIDRWLVLAFEKVQVLTVSEHLADAAMTLDAYEEAVLTARRQSIPDITVDAREPLAGRADGRILRCHGTHEGQTVRYLIGVFRDGATAMQVTGICPDAIAARHEDTLRQIIASLRILPPS